MICIGFSLHIAKEYHTNRYIAHHPNKVQKSKKMLVAFGSPPQAASKKAQRAETQGPGKNRNIAGKIWNIWKIIRGEIWNTIWKMFGKSGNQADFI